MFLADSASVISSDPFVTGHYIRGAGDAAVIRKGLEARDVRVVASLQQGDDAAIVTARGTPASVLSSLSGIVPKAPRAWLRVEGDLST